MAEASSTIAGVASLIDITLRGCNVLYDSIRYLRSEPELSEQLRRTVQSVQSVLRSLDEFITIHRQQRLSAGSPNFLPDAMNFEIISMKANLDALASSLPSPNSKSQLRRRLKWVLDRKKIAEVVQRLDRHQVTLILALQSFAQRKDISFHENLSRKLNKIIQQNESAAQNLTWGMDSFRTELQGEVEIITQQCGRSLSAHDNLDTRLENFQNTITAQQSLANNKLDAVRESISQTQPGGDQVRSSVRSSTVLAAPTEDVLARVFRAELRRVIMPAVEQCFQSFKANSDNHLDEIRRKIDRMTQQLESKCGEVERADGSPSADTLNQVSSIPLDNSQIPAVVSPCRLGFSTPVSPKSQDAPKNRRSKQWRRSWTFCLAIGTLWVTISKTVVDRKTSAEFHIGEAPSSNMTYQVTIEFLPSQILFQLRGLLLSISSSQDQRGYYQICPLVSTFAVIPDDAAVSLCAIGNDVEGLKSLFERRLAAPSDRTGLGRTPLMHATFAGALDACRFLLNEGADPLALDDLGHSSLDLAMCVFVQDSLKWTADYRRFEALTELLLQADGEIMEDSSLMALILILKAQTVKETPGRPISESLLNLQRLQELWLSFGYDFRDDWEDPSEPLVLWINAVQHMNVKLSREAANETLQTLLKLGASICGVGYKGLHPLLWIFLCKPKWTEIVIRNSIEIAVAFMRNGADPSALTYNGVSTFDLAEREGVTSLFLDALTEAGFDIYEIWRETKRRKWCFNNPDHSLAESTAIDDAQLAPPDTKGLVARRAFRGDRLEE